MVDFLSPEVFVQELASQAVVPVVASSSVALMLTTAVRGPISTPVTVTSLADYVSVFGPDDGAYGYQSAVGFFKNGGKRLVGVRVAHYTNITNLATLTAVAAESTLNTATVLATAASKTVSAGPWNFSPGVGVAAPVTLIVSIDGAGASTATIAATPSTVTAALVPGGAGTPGDTLTYSVNGVAQVYTVVGTPTTAADWAAEIGSQLVGVTVGVSAGTVYVRTDKYGSAADVSYVSATGTAGADSGFGAGPIAGINAGPNDVADLTQVTPAELAAVLAADWTGGGGVTVTPGASSVVVTTVATGVTASIGAVTGTAAAQVTVTPAGVVTGTAAGVAGTPTLVLRATSEGDHGNQLAVTTVRQDRVVATVAANILAAPTTEFTVNTSQALRIGMQVKLTDPVTTGVLRGIVGKISGNKVYLTAAVTPTAAITAANSPTVTRELFNLTITRENGLVDVYSNLSMSPLDTRFYVGYVLGSDPAIMDPRKRVYVEDQLVAPSNTVDPRPVNVTLQAFSGGLDSDPVVDLDWIGSESTGTGLYAADKNVDYSMLIVPGVENATVQRAINDFDNARKNHVSIMNVPANMTAPEAVTYVTATASLFGTYSIIYAGEIAVLRESNGQQEQFPAAGYLAGMFARTDYEENVAAPPGGTRKGRLAGTQGASNGNIYRVKANRDTVYPEGINPIFNKEGVGVVAYGQLTLDPSSDRGTISIRRTMLMLERALADITEFVLFELNTALTRQSWLTRVRGYLWAQWSAGVLQGSSADKAFYLKCDEENNPPSVVNARRFYGDVAVNLIPGIDWAIITIRRDTRSLEEELASAA